MKKKKIFSTLLSIIICITAVVGGYFLGNYYTNKYYANDPSSSIDPTTLYYDFASINYEGKNPSQLTPIEAYLVAEYILDNDTHNESTSYCTLETSAGISQYAYSKYSVNGDDYFYEYLSHSKFISVAKKCQYKKDGIMKIIDGKSSTGSEKDIVWNENDYEEISIEEYKNQIGRYPYEHFAYIVSDKTVEQSSCKLEDGLYVVHLVLNKDLASIEYKKQIKSFSGSKNNVPFIQLETTLYMDENFKVIKCRQVENYTINLGFNVDVYGDYEINYTYTN